MTAQTASADARFELSQFRALSLVRAGEVLKYEGIVERQGLMADKKLFMEVSCDGKVFDSFDFDFLSAYGSKMWAARDIVIPAEFPAGAREFKISLKEANARNHSLAETTMKVVVYKETLPRQKHLIEHFSHLRCRYCPNAVAVLEQVVRSREDVAWVSFHGWLSGPDEFTNSEYYQISQLNNVRGYPTATLNRSTTLEVNVYNAEEGANIVKSALDHNPVPALAHIDLAASYDKASKNITVKVACNSIKDIEKILGKTNLSVYLTEDNLVSNYTSQTYNRIFRAFGTPSAYGTPITWSNDRYHAEFTIPIKDEWKLEHMRAVAFISCEASGNSRGMTNLEVTNAEEVPLKEETTTALEKVHSEVNTEIARYNSTGKRISAPEKGLNIVKYSDGRVEKELVR